MTWFTSPARFICGIQKDRVRRCAEWRVGGTRWGILPLSLENLIRIHHLATETPSPLSISRCSSWGMLGFGREGRARVFSRERREKKKKSLGDGEGEEGEWVAWPRIAGGSAPGMGTGQGAKSPAPLAQQCSGVETEKKKSTLNLGHPSPAQSVN